MDDLGLSADVVGASSIFTGDEEVFAFARALVSCSTTVLLSAWSSTTLTPTPPPFAESAERDERGAVVGAE